MVCQVFEKAWNPPATSEAEACSFRNSVCFGFQRPWTAGSMPIAAITSAFRREASACCCDAMAARLAANRGGWLPRSLSHEISACTSAPTTAAHPMRGDRTNITTSSNAETGNSNSAVMTGE